MFDQASRRAGVDVVEHTHQGTLLECDDPNRVFAVRTWKEALL
jgi:hypothetical protein